MSYKRIFLYCLVWGIYWDPIGKSQSIVPLLTGSPCIFSSLDLATLSLLYFISSTVQIFLPRTGFCGAFCLFLRTPCLSFQSWQQFYLCFSCYSNQGDLLIWSLFRFTLVMVNDDGSSFLPWNRKLDTHDILNCQTIWSLFPQCEAITSLHLQIIMTTNMVWMIHISFATFEFFLLVNICISSYMFCL